MESYRFYTPLKNDKSDILSKYNQNYTNDINKNDSLENRNSEDIYNNRIEKRKTPFILTPKIILNNNNRYYNKNQEKENNSIKININKSSDLLNRIADNKIEKIFDDKTNNFNDILKDEYINMDEDTVNISTIHWKYNGPTGLNTEKKHFPTKSNIGSYFKTNQDKQPFSLNLFKSDYIKKYELNSNDLNNSKNSNIFNNNNNNISDINNKNTQESFPINNINSKSQQNINIEPRSKSYKNINTYNNVPYNNYYNRNNLYRYDEKSEYFVKINKDNINGEYKDDMKDMDDYYGNKRYRYYNPKRYDYKGSRFGDYNYNYYLNAPMRGDKSQSWKYPPLYYYNSGYRLYNKDNRNQNSNSNNI